MEKNRIKVSIIIPVYNTETYLEECLDSIINQTLRDIEIICIDDGSFDNSPQILDEYAEKDRRISVIHKENSGYGKAVNYGIEKARGEYVGIIEPDDYIKNGMLECLYNKAQEDELDIVGSDYYWFYTDNGNEIYIDKNVFEDDSLYLKILNPFQDISMMEGNFINPACLFRRKFLRKYGIKHNETPGAAFQDRGFSFFSLIFAERIMLLKDRFYCYRHDNPSSSIMKDNNMCSVIKEYQLNVQKLNLIEKKYHIFFAELFKREFGSCKYAFLRSSDKYNSLMQIYNEFNALRDKGMLETSKFPQSWEKQLQRILKDPEEFYRSIISLPDEIHDKICQFHKVVIYGAGMVGKYIYDVMMTKDRECVIGFAVTNIKNNIKYYKKCQVHSIGYYDSMKSEVAVIIGVTEQYRKQINNILIEKGFKNIIVLESEGTNI